MRCANLCDFVARALVRDRGRRKREGVRMGALFWSSQAPWRRRSCARGVLWSSRDSRRFDNNNNKSPPRRFGGAVSFFVWHGAAAARYPPVVAVLHDSPRPLARANANRGRRVKPDGRRGLAVLERPSHELWSLQNARPPSGQRFCWRMFVAYASQAPSTTLAPFSEASSHGGTVSHAHRPRRHHAGR